MSLAAVLIPICISHRPAELPLAQHQHCCPQQQRALVLRIPKLQAVRLTAVLR